MLGYSTISSKGLGNGETGSQMGRRTCGGSRMGRRVGVGEGGADFNFIRVCVCARVCVCVSGWGE